MKSLIAVATAGACIMGATTVSASSSVTLTAEGHVNEYRTDMPNHNPKKQILRTSAPHSYIKSEDLPASFTWQNKGGKSYVTKSLNQHIPQYCGSCWAHGAVSALSDRVKIKRDAMGADINLSVQHILNCGTDTAGSCYGGSHLGAYEWIHTNGFIAYDTENPYMACSADSKEGFCSHGDWTCSDINVARTCSTFTEMGGKCVGLDKGKFPMVSISEYGSVSGADKMKKEILSRGPIACGVDADPIRNYSGGVVEDGTSNVNHVISIVGWGSDDKGQYWIVRNSWGEYWGEMGYFRARMGKNLMGLESECAWAVPDEITTKNFPCGEDGKGCTSDHAKQFVQEPLIIN